MSSQKIQSTSTTCYNGDSHFFDQPDSQHFIYLLGGVTQNMKKLIFWIIAVAAISVGVLRAQDATGIWQGTLQPPNGKELRIVLKISKADDGNLKAILYSIDQGGKGMPITAITLQGSTIKCSMPGLGDYEGKLSADGTTITGSWTQGTPQPLNFKHVTESAAWAIPEPPAKLQPMAADADPTFEVATIKPGKPDQLGKLFNVRGRQFVTLNTTMNDLITFAYGIQVKQITGGAPWMESDKLDINAQPDVPGLPSSDQLKLMTRKLLADRFKLAFHHDEKELSVYALTVAKTGSKLTASASDPKALPSVFFRGLGQLGALNATTLDLAHTMQSDVLDRPVVDQTGLTGRYDYTLTWTADESQFGGLGIKVPPPGDKADAPPGLFTAIQEQMGMRLDPARLPVDVIVIDHVEKPSEN
jgi:uncharacterized protein (TIGR03435 family)